MFLKNDKERWVRIMGKYEDLENSSVNSLITKIIAEHIDFHRSFIPDEEMTLDFSGDNSFNMPYFTLNRWFLTSELLDIEEFFTGQVLLDGRFLSVPSVAYKAKLVWRSFEISFFTEN